MDKTDKAPSQVAIEAQLILLKQLASQGIQFAASFPIECGETTLPLTPEDVLEYKQSPDRLFAKLHGVTEEQCRQWKASNFNVQCSATTNEGHRCKNVVTGGTGVSLIKWVQLDGQYCDTHENGTGFQRRKFCR